MHRATPRLLSLVRALCLQAHLAVEEAEVKAEAAERKAKAAAPSKRKREAAALVAQHAALVAVADAIPKVLTGMAARAGCPSSPALLDAALTGLRVAHKGG